MVYFNDLNLRSCLAFSTPSPRPLQSGAPLTLGHVCQSFGAQSWFPETCGRTLAVATRATCEEAVYLDRDLVVLGNDVWATEAREQLEARFVALEEAELRVAPGGLEACHG